MAPTGCLTLGVLACVRHGGFPRTFFWLLAEEDAPPSCAVISFVSVPLLGRVLESHGRERDCLDNTCSIPCPLPGAAGPELYSCPRSDSEDQQKNVKPCLLLFHHCSVALVLFESLAPTEAMQLSDREPQAVFVGVGE